MHSITKKLLERIEAKGVAQSHITHEQEVLLSMLKEVSSDGTGFSGRAVKIEQQKINPLVSKSLKNRVLILNSGFYFVHYDNVKKLINNYYLTE